MGTHSTPRWPDRIPAFGQLCATTLALVVIAPQAALSQQRPQAVQPQHPERAVRFVDGPTREQRDPLHKIRVNPKCASKIVAAKAAALSDTLTQRLARECAYAHDFDRRRVMQRVARAELRRHGEIVMDIPEFHDEQRLAGDSQGVLGPIAGIFASPYLGSFRHRWQVEAHTRPGVLAGFVVVIQEDNEALPASYRMLNLQFGMNCIYLEAKGMGFIAWVAQPKLDAPCRDANGRVTMPPGATSLSVVVTPTKFPQDSMVAAARFLEDDQGRTVFGLPCLADWCQIGVSGFSPTTTNYCNWATATWICGTNKEAVIPSWYDEQQLEVKVGNIWRASSVRAAIVPQPGIADLPSSAFSNTRRHVATMYLDSDPPVNSRLYKRGIRKGESKVELLNDIAGGTGWQFIITPTAGGPSPMPVKILGPHRHYDAPIPGTSRWRFTILDPGIWGPCGQQCCDGDAT